MCVFMCLWLIAAADYDDDGGGMMVFHPLV
jgi:hypothetical protein